MEELVEKRSIISVIFDKENLHGGSVMMGCRAGEPFAENGGIS
jgi:hypothetical protein